MLQTFRNAWKIEEIRKKILFTLFMILLYRVGNAIPVPYVNVELLGQYFTQLESTVLGLVNVMSGGAFSSATIFALSIQPYINASIIIQLLLRVEPLRLDGVRYRSVRLIVAVVARQDLRRVAVSCCTTSRPLKANPTCGRWTCANMRPSY